MAEKTETIGKCYSMTEEALLKLYKKDQVGDCNICRKCRESNKKQCRSRPLSAWFVGQRFTEGDMRILFVGKNARGYFPNEDGVDDGINVVFSCRENLIDKGWAYWNYMRAIINEYFGDDDTEHVALTNMVKCNGSNAEDTTTDAMKNYCIKELGVLRKEMSIIKPTHVVFCTGWYYDDYVKFAFDSVKMWDRNAVRKIGAKEQPWGAGVGIVDGREIQFLRVCHPERKKKVDFVNGVVEWIQKNKELRCK